MIKVEKLSKSYGKKVVLNDVTLEIPNNKITFLIGENGVGKTTLLKTILKLESYTGDVSFDGQSIDAAYGNISAVYDDSPLYSGLSGYRNIQLLTNDEIGREEITAVASRFLSPEELKRKISNFSYGQRKKISIIIALLNNSKYVFMDEVSSGLDYESMKYLKSYLKDLGKHSVVFLTGHQFDFYNDIVDEVFILKNGFISSYSVAAEQKINLGNIYEETIKGVRD
ncbi:MAG: ATP-binding cassette domain-containing protein [bacterium]